MSDPGLTSKSESLPGKNGDTTVREFLWQHIELAHSKGFNDNFGRNPPPAVFEVCILPLY